MSKKIRDFIFILFVIIYIVTATVTCLFASGYKFNVAWPLQFNRLLIKTGTLSIASSPKNAFIFLNDKQQTSKALKLFKRDFVSTPYKIKNLLPGNYHLRLEKDNYWPIEMKFSVESGLTTTLENIHLFRSDLPTLVYKTEKNSILLSSSGDNMYLTSTQEFINLKYQSLDTKIKESISNGSWLMSGEEFFANNKIYNINDESIADLLPEHNETALSWKYDNDNNSIYYKTNSNSIYRLENDFKTSTNILSERSFLDYKQEGDSIFIVSEQNNRKYLQEFDISTQQELKMMELPTLGNYLFYSGNKNGHITLYDKQNSSLYLIDKNDWQKSFNIGQVKDWQFIDKNRIIYHNGWEITLLNTQDGTSYLLARVSDLIQKITWHSEENYFIFSTTGSIQAGDLQGNMLTTLFKTQEIGDIALDSKKNILYFYANIGQQAGIYKLMLK